MTHPARSERGQAFAIMIIALVALLGTAALTMDVGFAWYAKRQVQASADAAALAGAQQLPDIASATTTAHTYATLNTPDNLSNVTVGVTTRCSLNSGAYCSPTSAYQANTIAVTETAKTPTWFANVLGFNHFDVKGVATACQPCSSAPVDIMLVVDRTGSMCQSPDGQGNNVQDSAVCNDLNNAKDGVRALLGIMDPALDTVGLVAFPPYDSTGGICGSASQGDMNIIAGANSLATTAGEVDSGWYDSTALTYLDDPLGNTFKTSSAATSLNNLSTIVQHTVKDVSADNQNCIDSFGSTSYADALQKADDELVKDGRTGVPKVIVFMTDGEANEGSYLTNSAGTPIANHGLDPDLDNPATNFDMSTSSGASAINPGDAQPCRTAINTATAIKATGVKIYTIGYSLLGTGGSGYANCSHGVWGQVDGSYASSATDLGNFRCAPIGATLKGPNANKSWAYWPWRSDDYQNWPSGRTNTWYGFNPGHFQGAPISQSNPCTDGKYGTHLEQPVITSYATLSAIATPTVTGGSSYFYGSAGPTDIATIFAAIAADITKGTSRLVDDGY
jgi:hypothetical protein